MQERQTQVLALPARAEGRDRDTEGILKKKTKVPLKVEIQGIPRNSCRFHAGFGDTDPCRRVWKGMLLSFSLSDGLSQSPCI